MRSVYKIVILFLLLSVASFAGASGIKVDPSKLEITAKTNEPISREITVTNPTSDVQLFKIYADDFSDIIKANPASFTLEAGEEKKVVITIRAAGDQKTSGILKTNLSVVARSLAETKFETNAGVKVPVSISILESDPVKSIPKWEYYAYVSVVALAAGGVTHFLRRKRKARK
ncbi:MAG: hypothetical protein WC788_07760 [Candidatus Paceibacterota bacterium]|jgi:hypothetical protein